jgi:hypothetical protein
MNLGNLKWIKYVNPQGDEPWAYAHWQFNHTELHRLHWKIDQEGNARQVNLGDLVLLLQKSHVTHLIEIMDDAPRREGEGEWSIVRDVKVLWVADFKHENYIPRQRDLFGYSPKYAGGIVKNLENLKDIPPNWHSLDIFRRHVAGLLRLTD